MKFVTLLFATLPLFAQTPAPVVDNSLTGSIDLGYRWRTGFSGSADTYRSIVNLGSGLKLLSADFTLIDPSKRLFDKLNIRALNFGDDPYETLHVDASKQRLYRLSADYRNIAYFNNLPSFALGEQSFDTHRRLGSFDLDVLPRKWLTPYLAFNRSSSHGTGVTAFVADANEYAVPSRTTDAANQFRGGLRLELRRFHATLEEGATTYSEDQNLFSGPQTNSGNRNVPLLGNTLSLGSLLQNQSVSGNGIYSKALVSASPLSWLDLSAQLLFTQPHNDTHLSQMATGNFVLLKQLLFYTSQQSLIDAQAKLPHTSASFGAELRPFRRLRIVESLLTDRMHNSASSTSYTAGLLNNYTRQQADLFFDFTSHITVRAGYRHEWGNASQFLLPGDSLQSKDEGRLSRNAGIGGISFRSGQRFTANADAEVASSNDTYFRTSLHDYQKVRARARYQLTASINLAADFSFLNNDNPSAGIRYDSHVRQESASLMWQPQGGKRWSVQASYDRSAISSDITYLIPQDLSTANSAYRDNAHSLTALVDANLARKIKLSFGGTAFLSSGSRPSQFYQPTARISVPQNGTVTWFSEWAWYGFGENFYRYESFHTHLLTAGLRLTR